MQVQEIERVFVFENKGKKIELKDPNKNMSAQKVIDFYSDRFPVFVTAEVTQTGIVGNKLIFDIKTKPGTKG